MKSWCSAVQLVRFCRCAVWQEAASLVGVAAGLYRMQELQSGSRGLVKPERESRRSVSVSDLDRLCLGLCLNLKGVEKYFNKVSLDVGTSLRTHSPSVLTMNVWWGVIQMLWSVLTAVLLWFIGTNAKFKLIGECDVENLQTEAEAYRTFPLIHNKFKVFANSSQNRISIKWNQTWDKWQQSVGRPLFTQQLYKQSRMRK